MAVERAARNRNQTMDAFTKYLSPLGLDVRVKRATSDGRVVEYRPGTGDAGVAQGEENNEGGK